MFLTTAVNVCAIAAVTTESISQQMKRIRLATAQLKMMSRAAGACLWVTLGERGETSQSRERERESTAGEKSSEMSSTSGLHIAHSSLRIVSAATSLRSAMWVATCKYLTTKAEIALLQGALAIMEKLRRATPRNRAAAVGLWRRHVAVTALLSYYSLRGHSPPDAVAAKLEVASAAVISSGSASQITTEELAVLIRERDELLSVLSGTVIKLQLVRPL